MDHSLKSVLTSKLAIALAALAVFSLALLGARIAFTGRVKYVFMAWNLFLAFVPWAIATALDATKRANRAVVFLVVLAWLAFFPNSPYVLTDLLHLGYDNAAPGWYDLILLLSFGFSGTLFGFASLKTIESLLAEAFKIKFARLASFPLIYVSCFGIYLGRFLRWNSWDLVTNLEHVARDVYERISDPIEHASAWVFTFLFGTLLSLLYLGFKSFGDPLASRGAGNGNPQQEP
jgi:uncharacterized membrane protein